MRATDSDPFPDQASHNPFAAPQSRVDDPRPGDPGPLRDQPRRTGAGDALAWFGEGWRLFREAPGTWIGVLLILFLFNLALAFIPFVNMLGGLIHPVLIGGLMLGCHSLAQGRGLGLGHLFSGFQRNFGSLVLIGLLNLLGAVATGVIVFFSVLGTSGATSLFTGFGQAGAPPDPMLLLLAALLALALMIPLIMAVWFAPALVVLHDKPTLEAMGLSFRGCLHNMWPFLVYGLAGLVLAILATIPIGLGWLVLVPVTIGSTYAAYRNIFVD